MVTFLRFVLLANLYAAAIAGISLANEPNAVDAALVIPNLASAALLLHLTNSQKLLDTLRKTPAN